jgi:lipoprotein-anchoring transpeptidase ErfK/SrfK
LDGLVASGKSETLRSDDIKSRKVFTKLSSRIVVVCAFGLAGCATNSNVSTTRDNFQEGEKSAGSVAYWIGDGVTGRPSIKIDLENQRAYFYKGQQVVGVSVVSTGREGYNTPSGEFNVTQKDVDHISSLYGDYVDPNGEVVVQNVENGKDPKPPGTAFRGAPMPYFLRIQGGIGLHAGYLPGYPASHGCVRLPEGMALKFFEDASVGTPVEIR